MTTSIFFYSTVFIYVTFELHHVMIRLPGYVIYDPLATERVQDQWTYVSCSFDLTYSPAVTTSYLAGRSSDTQPDMG